MSSDEEFELNQDGKITILGNGISNQFTLYMSFNKEDEFAADTPAESNSAHSSLNLTKSIEKFRLAFHQVKIFIWPTFRLPTGSSVIALINTSYLFATKRLE